MIRTRIYVIATIALVSAFLWYEIDRSDPFIYQDAYFDVKQAAPGQKVKLTLVLKWPRANCSTELERTFIGSDGKIRKILDAEGHSTVHLGPPPKTILGPDNVVTSTRDVILPSDLPDGEAIHSPNAWERCTSPVVKWGDYLTELWPIFIGPKGADAKIIIRR